MNEWKRKIRRRSVCVLLKVADIGCFQYSACVCQCLSIAGISEKSFPLTKGEAPDFETFVNTFLGNIQKSMQKHEVNPKIEQQKKSGTTGFIEFSRPL